MTPTRRMLVGLLACLAVAAVVVSLVIGRDSQGAALLADDRLGGEVTVAAVTQNAFGLPAPGLVGDQRRSFELGDSFFTQPWVIAPASTAARDGLGPDFNANSCAACHVRDGRAQPLTGEAGAGLLLRLSIPGVDDHGGPLPHPVYGGQLTDRATEGAAEGMVMIDHEIIQGTYADGTAYELERPTYRVVDWRAGDPGEDLLLSPRVAPQIIGVGLLEAIPEADIRAGADPDDADADGISGRANEVWSPHLGAMALGRFGWKANTATLADQAAEAFVADIGITSSVRPHSQDCTRMEEPCPTPDSEAGPEIPDDRLDRVVFYTSTLAVPAMRNLEDDAVREGAEQFVALNCVACHTPSHTTGDSDIAALAGQTIRPFSDLLLHDMGADLADGRTDHLASGNEWRTPPLWGIGLVESINGHTRFLHDGRARTLEEAVLWHGGEAQASADAFRASDATQRAALLQFLESL